MNAPSAPRFLDAGEAALVVEFGMEVDPAINDRVLGLDAALMASALPGVRETVPTYRSLMVHYDPLVIGRAALIAEIEKIAALPQGPREPANRWTIPCCYDPEFGEDVDHIAAAMGLTRDQVVSLHAGATYRVYMYGFAPGFAYLGGLPKELGISRRVSPRPPHPANTILIAGGLSIISTFSMPTGWWLIGRTPERLFAPEREPTFLVEVGDALHFEPIDRATFETLEKRASAGEIVSRRERLS